MWTPFFPRDCIKYYVLWQSNLNCLREVLIKESLLAISVYCRAAETFLQPPQSASVYSSATARLPRRYVIVPHRSSSGSGWGIGALGLPSTRNVRSIMAVLLKVCIGTQGGAVRPVMTDYPLFRAREIG